MMAALAIGGCTNAPDACLPVPSENQLRWQEMEYYAFIHYSLNTYTDQSWGYGNESLELFNPSDLDCRQWARICKEAGMTGIIFTAKHHCGFCMWPSEYTEYSVKNTPWKDGKGDVMKELSEACREYGLKLGVYLSPWDRNAAFYGKDEYVEYFRNQMRELLTNYGPVFETWFDGANGGNGYYGGANETRRIDAHTYYQWAGTFSMIRELQPGIVIWNDGGDRGDLRWVGTEAGYVGETNWSMLNHDGDVPFNMLHYGLEDGDSWVAAEVNTSIRPEWFYHESENHKVKSVPKLMETYYNSVGRNATLLLNVPVMPNGLIHPTDEQRLKDFAQARSEAFAVNLTEGAQAAAGKVRGGSRRFDASKAIDGNTRTYWTTDDGVKEASLMIDFGKSQTFNRFQVQEYIRLGQRVKSFKVEAFIEGSWKEITKGTTIGYKRILCFPTVTADRLRFTVLDSRACPLISEIAVFNAPQILDAPTIIRRQDGTVVITPNDPESTVYYTLDGSEPGTSETQSNRRYRGGFPTDGKITVKAISVEESSGRYSPSATERFDLPRTAWKVVPEAQGSQAVIDGDPQTAWHAGRRGQTPEITVDMGAEQSISGFTYLPDPAQWGPCVVSFYRFETSADGMRWQTVSEGEFSNIKNNPVLQTKNFPPVRARYFRLVSLRNTDGGTEMGCAEVGVITE